MFQYLPFKSPFSVLQIIVEQLFKSKKNILQAVNNCEKFVNKLQCENRRVIQENIFKFVKCHPCTDFSRHLPYLKMAEFCASCGGKVNATDKCCLKCGHEVPDNSPAIRRSTPEEGNASSSSWAKPLRQIVASKAEERKRFSRKAYNKGCSSASFSLKIFLNKLVQVIHGKGF